MSTRKVKMCTQHFITMRREVQLEQAFLEATLKPVLIPGCVTEPGVLMSGFFEIMVKPVNQETGSAKHSRSTQPSPSPRRVSS